MSIKQATATVDISYEQYHVVLSRYVAHQEVAIDFRVPPVLLKMATDMADYVKRLSADFGTSAKDIVQALLNRDVYALLKAIKFNLKTLFSAVTSALGLVHLGLLTVMKHLLASKLFQELKKGAVKIDQVLDEYPLLKKLTGLALAGFLFWCWCSMSFTGNIAYDFDVSDIGAALVGSYGLSDLLSPEGLEMLTLVVAGSFGLGFPWLTNTMYNLVIAVVMTGARHARNTALFRDLAQAVPRIRV